MQIEDLLNWDRYTVRLLISLAAHHRWKIYHLDVKLAFLNGIPEEEVYVQQPEGFLVKGQEDKVYRLKKALYDKHHGRGMPELMVFFIKMASLNVSMSMPST